MNQRDFKKLIKARQKHTDATLIVKGAEYARGNDRLHNFYRAAAMNEETAPQALWGMMGKHLVSLMDMIDDTAEGIYPSEAQITEKIGDSINYLHLLEALFVDGLESVFAVAKEQEEVLP
jgi:hypothetical protein